MRFWRGFIAVTVRTIIFTEWTRFVMIILNTCIIFIVIGITIGPVIYKKRINVLCCHDLTLISVKSLKIQLESETFMHDNVTNCRTKDRTGSKHGQANPVGSVMEFEPCCCLISADVLLKCKDQKRRFTSIKGSKVRQ